MRLETNVITNLIPQVKTTLNLQESEIANFQASEAVNQGKKVAVFTLVTVWFVRSVFASCIGVLPAK